MVYDELMRIRALSHLGNSVRRELAHVIVFESHPKAGEVREYPIPCRRGKGQGHAAVRAAVKASTGTKRKMGINRGVTYTSHLVITGESGTYIHDLLPFSASSLKFNVNINRFCQIGLKNCSIELNI